MSLARVEEAKLAYEQAMQLDGGAAVRAEAAQVPNAYIQAHAWCCTSHAPMQNPYEHPLRPYLVRYMHTNVHLTWLFFCCFQ